MPSLFAQQEENKDQYLQNLCLQTYLRDIVNWNHIVHTRQLDEIIYLTLGRVVDHCSASMTPSEATGRKNCR